MSKQNEDREYPVLSYIKSTTRDTVQSIGRNSLMSMVSIVSIVAALLILGIFVIFSVNVQEITQNVEAALELKVFIKKDATVDQINNLEQELLKNDAVESVTFQSAEDALKEFSDSLEEYSGLLSGYTNANNPMRASYTLRIQRSDDIMPVKSYCESLTDMGVDYVKYGEEYVDFLMKFSRYSKIFCAVMVVILTLVSGFIIFNTIKLTCFARRHEIRVMRYVGAPDWYIRMPFVLEGTFLGAMGAVAAILLIRTSYYFLIAYVKQSVYMPMDSALVSPMALLIPLSWACLLYGIIVGASGSLFSIRKFLDV